MIKLRSLLKESLDKNIVNTILDELKPTISDMVNEIEKSLRTQVLQFSNLVNPWKFN